MLPTETQIKSKYYIGYSKHETERHRASSGGIGTAVIKYLLSQQEYGTSITFLFDKEKCMYIPKMIYSADDINICGSVYQDIDLYKFIKDNVEKIKDGIVVTCPPCQITAIHQYLSKKGIKSFILSFCCSGQTTVEGTWCYYKFLGIHKEDVVNIQYRGNGWPSGIQIWTKDGKKEFHPNYSEPWATIHRSWLFRPNRCFFCKRDTGHTADIALADPWLKEYTETDDIGHTLFITNTESGENVVESLLSKGLIDCIPSNYDDYALAQKPNIQKELNVIEQKGYLRKCISLKENKLYFNWATESLKNMKKHMSVLKFIRVFSSSKNLSSAVSRRFSHVIMRIRSNRIAKRLGKCSGGFHTSGGVELNNPRCIYVGKNVGIGEGTFMGPVVEYAGIAYNPKIIIGDGTWIGKHCSIAAINRVQIGKHVLFAGHVHITDHSHGYEDISKPILPQKLTCKGPVIIDDDCWLGFNCEILSGVHIGKHCVVAARAVVTKDVPPYCIVAGNPAKIVKRYNFETQQWEKERK